MQLITLKYKNHTLKSDRKDAVSSLDACAIELPDSLVYPLVEGCVPLPQQMLKAHSISTQHSFRLSESMCEGVGIFHPHSSSRKTEKEKEATTSATPDQDWIAESPHRTRKSTDIEDVTRHKENSYYIVSCLDFPHASP